jgi:glycosyltransferase involved in cell wall biosynthesis
MEIFSVKLAIFTPTYRPGGLDVTVASLMRQTFRNFVWVVSDQRFLQRKETWAQILREINFPTLFANSLVEEGNKRNLCASYNAAADYVVEDGFDMLISLQDYIYVPEDGLEKFISVHNDHPNDLLTGVTHISRDPFPNKIVDLEGDYTIFAEPYTSKPKHFSWKDVRATEIYIVGDDILPIETGHWEANWAAIPTSILDAGVRWDETYDRGIAYENMDFAQRAKERTGAKVILDKTNVAISLPHKDYFEGEREEIEEFSNRDYYNTQWQN